MKALVKKLPERGLWLEDVPMPECGDGDVLIQVLSSSICGTDLHLYEWDAWAQSALKPPLVIGHEFCGKVVKTGSQVHSVKVGDRVAGEGHITCGKCRNCLRGMRHICPNTLGLGVKIPGCFAEYVVLPAENVFLLPDSIPDDVASVLDPLGNAFHTILSFDVAGEDVLILGCGPIGLMSASICKHLGARRIVACDLQENKLEMARSMGATHTFNPTKTTLAELKKELNLVDGFEVVLEMSGSMQALSLGIEAAANGGNIGLLGILPKGGAVDWPAIIFKMLNLKGIYGREIFSTWQKMTRMLESGLDISQVITKRLHYTEFKEGFEAMARGDAGKIVLHWQ